MKEELPTDPLLDDALQSLRKARMLMCFVRDALRYPDMRRNAMEELNEASKALDDAIEATSTAVARTADANGMLSILMYQLRKRKNGEDKDE